MTLIIAAVVALVIIGSATVLVAMHDLDAAAYTSLVATALTATGLGGIQLGNKAINGGTTYDFERLARNSPDIASQVANNVGAPPYPASAPHVDTPRDD